MDNQRMRTALALGSFDGVHLGHRAVLKAADKKKAEGLLPLALVFSPHPQQVLRGQAPEMLSFGRIREELFSHCGVGLKEIDFYGIKDMSPQEFFEKILIAELNASFISCGFNYSFGKKGRGDVALLSQLCSEHGLGLFVADEVCLDGISVSSTRIREALIKGEIELANRMLGRAFSYDFLVVSGDRRGRLLGFPTINQFFPENFAVPKYGVYASKAFAEGRWYDAVTNIGLRPTVGGSAPRSETCLLGYSGDLYSQNVEVRLFSYLREEVRFDSFEELSAQISRDASQAGDVLQKISQGEEIAPILEGSHLCIR